MPSNKSGKPSQPNKPGQPGQPGQPSQPSQPNKPGKPSLPNKPGQLSRPNKSSKPAAGSPSTPASSPSRPRKGVVIGALVAVAALLAGWLSQYAVGANPAGAGGGSGAGSGNATVEGRSDDTAAGDPALLKLARRSADDPFARGEKDAPVVMIEYADFGCSFCGKFARDTAPKLVKKYVEKGLLRIEWRNFPVFGKGSERAALASYAAGQQDRFWQFYDAVYADKGNEKGAFTTGRLHEIAEQAGVKDLDRFDRDRASGAARKLLNKDRTEAYRLGASATPAFLVNGQPIAGAQPDEAFTDAIERAAAAAKKSGQPTQPAKPGRED